MTDTRNVRPNGKRQPTKDELQREQAQEARFGSFEHGAPETGPGEDFYVDNIANKDGDAGGGKQE